MPSESDVFISYATDTKPEAEELARALERHGIQAWADFKDLRPGQRWQEEIDRAVESADLFLILVGHHSSATPRLEAEWRAALANAWSDSKKTVIPILFGPADLPPFLRSWVPLRVDPALEPTKWTLLVLDALRSQRKNLKESARPENRRVRERRLDEIMRAAEQLKDRESGSERSPKTEK